MKKIKKFLKKLDVFGVPMSFKYKLKDTYSTSLGGFIMIIYCMLVLFIVFFYFIKFINKENFTTIYYTVNLHKTEALNVKESKSVFSFGLDCLFNGRFKAEDILTIESRYTVFTKTTEGVYNKNVINITTHSCSYKDFFNNYNESFDRLNLKNFQCLDDYGKTLEGIYSDPIFSYYEFCVVSKYDNLDNLDNIEEFLFQNDCKLQIVYTDTTIDLNNYKEPIKNHLNEEFIQLNPTLFIKRNMFLMNQYLTDDDAILFNLFRDLNYSFTTILYSRYEEYSLYLGLNRSKTKPPDYNKYARLYIRADTKKTDIRRNYQNLLEFYADVSSLLLGIFRFLIIILGFINTFYAECSFSKRIFIFKDFDNKHFNISKKIKEIKEIKYLIENYKVNDTNNSSYESDFEDFYSKDKVLENYELNSYNKFKKRNIDINNQNQTKSFSYKNPRYANILKEGKNYKFQLSTSNLDDKRGENKKSSENIEFKKNTETSSIEKVLEKKIDKNKSKEMNKESKVIKNKYKFNILEIILISFLKCFTRPRNINLKRNLYEKISNILYNKLDIVLFIKNQFFFDTMNEILLNSNNKDIINFLYRPILSAEKSNIKNNSCKLNYHHKNIEFDKFYERISELIQKQNLTQKEKNLILLSQQKLLALLNNV